MALSGLDIYKLLPKTNCKECGFPTCLAFAMQLAKKAVSVEKCPYVSLQAKATLDAASQPPVKQVSLGFGDAKFDIGNETVMFRHEEKFRNPCGVGFIIEDSLSDAEIKSRLAKINLLNFERVGQKLDVNLVAIKQAKDPARFVQAVKLTAANTKLAVALMSEDPQALKQALDLVKDRKPLIYGADSSNFAEMGKLAKEFNAALAIKAKDLEDGANITQELAKLGVFDLVIETQAKNISGKIWDLTQARRLALKKSVRSLGFPALVKVEKDDPYEEALEAATYILKYASLVLIKGLETWQVLALLTLRQNIYTDPQKPLQIEPKVYPIGAVGKNSPVLVTTNFSLSYYTVLSEVEASKIGAHIMSVDTEGMSVLTAWAAEKFTAGKITETLNKFNLSDIVAHKKLIIPGYVAMMSGDLADESGWQIIVGPKEAAGIPSFLKNL